jgi:D-alanyl-D-alanine carboxypeptidase
LRAIEKTFWLIPLLLALLFPLSSWAQPAPNSLTAESVLLLDPQGRVLFSKNAEGGHAPASLVKLMTLYLAFEALNSESNHWDEDVVVSAYAARTPPYRLGLRSGEKVALSILLQGIAIASANDAATAVAEHLAGSEEAFVARMNEQAAELGLTQTHYANPHGLPALHQQTTARDIARLTDYLLERFPASRELLSGKSFVYRGRVFQRQILLDRSPDGVQAVKTGYTQVSGYNLAVAAYRGSQRFLVILLGSETRLLSFLEARKLLQFGFLQNGFHIPSDPPRPVPKKVNRQKGATTPAH